MTRVSGQPIRALGTLPRSDYSLPAATVSLYMNSGGDERIRLDPLTGRTRYGTTGAPAENEIWFSSSTASSVHPRSFAAAGVTLARFISTGRSHDADVKSWLDGLRSRLNDRFGIPGGEVVLAASGTEAEFAALSVARALLQRPLTNIVVAPEETGRGVMNAAAGRHFLGSSSLGGAVTAGAILKGFDRRPVETQGIAIRDEAGYPRDPSDIDRDAAVLVAQALAAGRDVLLHVLDASKTGLAGVTRETARMLAKQARGRLAIVVDACQLRCQPLQLQEDVEAGFIVMITGSKFAAGPPFAGALLLSPSTVERLAEPPQLPAGLSAYSARFDWPEVLRGSFAADLETPVNLGLALRWEAALAAIEPYFALPEALRFQILSWFAGKVHRLVADRPHLKQVAGEPSRAKTIIPVETLGEAATPAGAAELYAALASPQGLVGAPSKLAKACHLGQPVPIGARAALRICASMPMVLDVAARIMDGEMIEAAVAPVVADLELLFEKWDWLAGA
jgi:hypothetical protein